MCPQPVKSLWSTVKVHCIFCCQFFRATCSFYLWALTKIQVAGFPFTLWCSSIFRTFLNSHFPKQTPVYWCFCVTQGVAVMWQLHIICRWGSLSVCTAWAEGPWTRAPAGAWSSTWIVFPRCTKQDQALHLSLPLFPSRTWSSVCPASLSAH